MTPEERWIKIENALQSLIGSQGQHEAEIAEHRRQLAENDRQFSRIAEQMERMERKTSQIDAQIEKNTAAIRDLIVVSRTVIDAQQASEERTQRMHAEIKTELELLIKAINAFVKGFQKPNGNQ